MLTNFRFLHARLPFTKRYIITSLERHQGCWWARSSKNTQLIFVLHILFWQRVVRNMAGLWTLCLIAFSMTDMIIPLTAKPCFITNCPPGGKRSSQLVEPSSYLEIAEEQMSHQVFQSSSKGLNLEWCNSLFFYLECAPCGPAGKGTCFGANLCCGSHFGCFFKTEETNICMLANLKSNQSCDKHFWKTNLRSASCSLNGDKFDGICVADLLCCSLGNPN